MKKLPSFFLAISCLCLSLYGCQSKKDKQTAMTKSQLNLKQSQNARLAAAPEKIDATYSLSVLERSSVKESSPKTISHLDQGDRLSVQDVIALKKAGLSNDKIKTLIQQTNSTYTLNSRDIHKLENAGVDQEVINLMMKENHM